MSSRLICWQRFLRCPTADLQDALAKLEAAELIFSRGPPDASYVFKHALVQDAAYETLLKSKRQLLHAGSQARLKPASPKWRRPSRRSLPTTTQTRGGRDRGRVVGQSGRARDQALGKSRSC